MIPPELPPLGPLASGGDAFIGSSRAVKVIGSSVRRPIVDGPELGARAVDEPVLLLSRSLLRRFPRLLRVALNVSYICWSFSSTADGVVSIGWEPSRDSGWAGPAAVSESEGMFETGSTGLAAESCEPSRT